MPSLRLAPTSARAQARESASLRHRLRNAHHTVAAGGEERCGGSGIPSQDDAHARYAERIRRRLEAALDPPSPGNSPRSPGARGSPAGSVASQRSFASSTASSGTRPPWDGSPNPVSRRAPSPRATQPPARSPTRETWFGAPNKDFSWGACQKEARQLAQAGAEARAAQQKRVEQMLLVSKSTAPAVALAHSPSGSLSGWDGTTKRQRRRSPTHLTDSNSPASHAHTRMAGSFRSPSPRQFTVNSARRQVDMDALPAGWETATSQTTGSIYYINTITGESTYQHPTSPAAAATRSRAGGRSGEDWASDVLSQIQLPPSPAATRTEQELGTQRTAEQAQNAVERALSEQVKIVAERRLAAQEAAQKQTAEKREKEHAKIEAAERKAAEKAAKQRMLAEKEAAQKQAAKDKRMAEERAAAERKVAVDHAKALSAAEAKKAAQEASGGVDLLPVGWEEHRSTSTGEMYWLNTVTWETVFERPTAPATVASFSADAGREELLDKVDEISVVAEADADQVLRAQVDTTNNQQERVTKSKTGPVLAAQPVHVPRLQPEAAPVVKLDLEHEFKSEPEPEPEPEPELAVEAMAEAVAASGPEPEPEPQPHSKQVLKRNQKFKKTKAAAAERKAAEERQKQIVVEEEAAMLEQAAKTFSSTLTLPAGWEEARSRSSGEMCYRNVFTGESTYDLPTGPAAPAGVVPGEKATMLEQAANMLTLPAGWEEVRSRSSDEMYYRNVFTGESTYDFPTGPAAPAGAMSDTLSRDGSEPDFIPSQETMTEMESSAGSLAQILQRDPEGTSNADNDAWSTAFAISENSATPKIANDSSVHQELGELRAELSRLKVSQLRKRAIAEGASVDVMDDAVDANDEKGVLIDLIIHMAGENGGTSRELDDDSLSQQSAAIDSVAEIDEPRIAGRLAAPAATSDVSFAPSSIAPQPEPALTVDIESLHDELTIYLASGKNKHPRFFWLTRPSNSQINRVGLALHWGKKLNDRQSKVHTLLGVVDKPTIPDAEQLFHDMDEDNSGYLDETEVAMVYKKARGEKLSKSKLTAAMHQMDRDGDNQVSMEEFKTWWTKNGGDLEQHRDRAFTFLCEGGIEVLVVAKDMQTKQRWVSSCAQLLPAGVSNTMSTALSSMLTLYHMTGAKKHSRYFWMDAESKKLSWGKTLRSKTCKTERLLRVIDAPTVPDARELFNQIDTDQSGYLDSTEVAALYKKARGERLAGKKLKKAMKVMDTDGNDQVSLTEFETWWVDNGGDLEKHRARAMTFVFGSGIELLVVAPDAATKRRWLDSCEKLSLVEHVEASRNVAPQVVARIAPVDSIRLHQLEDALPDGWETATSQSTGQTYYINTLTGDSTYDMPVAPADALQTELQVTTPAAPVPGEDPEVLPVSVANPQEQAKNAGSLAKQAEKEAKKLKKEEAKRAKKAAKNRAKSQKVKAKKEQAEPDLEALAKALPSGWEPAVSQSSGDVYYVNTVSGDSTYDRPSESAFTDSFLSMAGPEVDDALPEGWEAHVSRTSGDTYYVNVYTEESTYDRPTVPASRIGHG